MILKETQKGLLGHSKLFLKYILLQVNQIPDRSLPFSVYFHSGYMAPEYASEGIFSIKSDVFSFGVLIIEIVSGTRNSGFHQFGNFFNLLGYVSILNLLCKIVFMQ